MRGKFGPWIAAAIVGTAVLAAGFVASEALPERYRTTGQLVVPPAALRSLPESWPDPSQVNRWLLGNLPVRPHVEVEESDSIHPRILITAEAANAEDAAAATNETLRRAQQDLQTLGVRFADERHRSLLTLLHRARNDRSRAQQELDQRIFAKERAVADQTAPPPPPAPVTVAAPVPVVHTRNPLWDDMARQIAEMEGRRAGLLLTMTPAHPVIHDLDWRIAQLKSQLQSAPEFNSAPDPAAVGPLPQVATAPAPSLVPATPLINDGDERDEIRRQRFVVAAADMQLGVAIQHERDAWQQLSELRSDIESCVQQAPLPSAAELSPARDPIRGGSAVLAFVLSGTILWRARPKRHTLRTLEDVRRTLGVPVIGKLSATAR